MNQIENLKKTYNNNSSLGPLLMFGLEPIAAEVFIGDVGISEYS